MARLRLITASLKRQRGLYILWILSLAAAVSGLIIVDVYRHSLTGTLQTQGRKILTADASLSARRMLTEDEEKIMAREIPGAKFARLTEMFAMITAKGESRLALMRFASDEYPLVGELTMGGKAFTGKDLGEAPLAAAAGDLFTLLDLKPGDALKIGDVEFKLTEALDVRTD